MESAIPSIVDLFESDNSTAGLQIDATNAFNSLNRNVFYTISNSFVQKFPSSQLIVARYHHVCSLEGDEN